MIVSGRQPQATLPLPQGLPPAEWRVSDAPVDYQAALAAMDARVEVIAAGQAGSRAAVHAALRGGPLGSHAGPYAGYGHVHDTPLPDAFPSLMGLKYTE